MKNNTIDIGCMDFRFQSFSKNKRLSFAGGAKELLLNNDLLEYIKTKKGNKIISVHEDCGVYKTIYGEKFSNNILENDLRICKEKLGHGKYIIRKIDGSEYDITTRKTNKIVAMNPTEIVKKHTAKGIIISETWLQRNFTTNNQYDYVSLDNDILDIIIDKKNFLNTLIFDNIKIAETLHNIDNIVIYTSDTNNEKYIVCKEIMNREFNKLDIKIHRIK
jgi:hypothetical protein